MAMTNFLEKFIDEVNLDDIQIVSFDIFDTLIIREYLFPTDLFAYVPGKMNLEFKKKRIYAEMCARKMNDDLEDVNMEMIYDLMPPETHMFKELELKLEKISCSERSEIKEIYEYVKCKNKKIICISDMYLDSSVIREIIEHNGYQLDEIFVSNEYNKSKSSGTLFEEVIKHFKISPQSICHIGDNFKSDIQNANRYGLRTFFTMNYRDQINLRIKIIGKYRMHYFLMLTDADYDLYIEYRKLLYSKIISMIKNDCSSDKIRIDCHAFLEAYFSKTIMCHIDCSRVKRYIKLKYVKAIKSRLKRMFKFKWI